MGPGFSSIVFREHSGTMEDKTLPQDNCVLLAKTRGKMNDNDGDKGGPGDEGTVGADCDNFGLVEGELR